MDIIKYTISGDTYNLKRILNNPEIDINIISNDGYTPLMITVIHHDVKCFKLLINAKADPNIRDKYGLTSLMFALGINMKLCKLLIKAGANPNLRTNLGTTALAMSVYYHSKFSIVFMWRKRYNESKRSIIWKHFYLNKIKK